MELFLHIHFAVVYFEAPIDLGDLWLSAVEALLTVLQARIVNIEVTKNNLPAYVKVSENIDLNLKTLIWRVLSVTLAHSSGDIRDDIMCVSRWSYY